MKLRELQPKDAPLMLEWMHDPDVVRYMRADFASKTLEDCLRFIRASKDSKEDLHCAIVNNEDEYMGTVSLKRIRDGKAEFAITVRACAMGKGYAQFGMHSIIEKGFSELGLDEIDWCVAPENARALQFYDKNGYERREKPGINPSAYSPEETTHMTWYCIKAEACRDNTSINDIGRAKL